MEIKIDVVSLSKAANQMKTEIKNLRSSILAMQNVMNTDMHSHWVGSDYDEGFIKKMNPFLEETLTDYVNGIELYQKYLQNYLDGFTALHSYYAKKTITIVGK